MEWHPVMGWEGHYEVSRDGDLRTIDGEPVGQWLSDQGYCLARLSQPRRMVRVHRLVAQAFCSNPLGLPSVNHINCRRDDNAASNLEWCTQSDNLRHSQRLGRMKYGCRKGHRSPQAKLTDSAAQSIKKDYATTRCSLSSLAIKYGSSKRTIGRIIKGQSYV